MKIARNLRPRAILLALALFAILASGVNLFARYLVRDISHVHTRLMLLNTLAPLTFVICGFFSGVASRRLGTVHGAIFGLFSFAVSAAFYIIYGGIGALIHYEIHWVIIAIILGALGGFIWDIYNRVRSKTSNKVLKADAAKNRRAP